MSPWGRTFLETVPIEPNGLIIASRWFEIRDPFAREYIDDLLMMSFFGVA